MTITAPPRPPRTPRPNDPIGREEIEALVEALIEEARQRARRRRRRYVAAALSVLLTGLAAYVGFARGGSDLAGNGRTGGSGTLSARGVSLSFDLLSTPTSIRTVDRAPKGVPSKGDTREVKSVLRNRWAKQFDRPRNAVVGRDSWVWTVLAKPGWALVRATVTLPGGTLRLRRTLRRGPFSGRNPLVVPVVGGTGRFANARGICQFTRRSGNRPYYADYELRLPSS